MTEDNQTSQTTAREKTASTSPKHSPGKRTLLGLYLLLMPIFLAYLVFALWPVEIEEAVRIENRALGDDEEQTPPDADRISLDDDPTSLDDDPIQTSADDAGTISKGETAWDPKVSVLGFEGRLADDSRLLLLVLLIGALGSYVHAATSFASYVGNETLRYSWIWWYILRPFVGMTLAWLFYFVVRGGFLSTADADAQVLSLYGIAALAGLAGMFSKQTTDKLNETFTTFFRTSKGEGDDARRDKLHHLEPVESVMIPYDKIEKVVVRKGQTDQGVLLGDLVDKLGPTVTRVPVFDSEEHGKYVIHEGLLCRYVAQRTRKEGSAFDLGKATLEDFLQQGRNRALVESLVFVPRDATLAEAQEAMEKVEHCRDAFVTENGKKEERVLGWLTNGDIAKRLGK